LIEELGLGRLGMSYTDLYDMIPRSFWNAVDGYWLSKENEDRKAWERTRWSTCILVNMQLPKGKQLTLQKLIRFDWEEEIKKIPTYEETNAIYQRFIKQQKSMKL
tara:strand:+ start:2631 stop:2945 length:315 start_codon:yes stop_codon:yes gene_type:complete